MPLTFRLATDADIPALLALRRAVGSDQERRFGHDRWTTTISERSIARGLRFSRVLVALDRRRIVGTLRMEARKPWAIDLRYFTAVPKAVYLHDVDVAPERQRTGIGRALVEHAKVEARAWRRRDSP
jgi:predicted N-acetyltransferase YhbS